MLERIDKLFDMVNEDKNSDQFGCCYSIPLSCAQSCCCQCTEYLSPKELQTLNPGVLVNKRDKYFRGDKSMQLFCQMVRGQSKPNDPHARDLQSEVIDQPGRFKFLSEGGKGETIDPNKIGLLGAIVNSEEGEKQKQVTIYEFRKLMMDGLLVFQAKLFDKLHDAYKDQEAIVDAASGMAEVDAKLAEPAVKLNAAFDSTC